MKVGTVIKITYNGFTEPSIYYYQLREGKFTLSFEMSPGFPGFEGDFEGKYFYCLGAVFPNPNAWNREGEIEGLNLMRQEHEVITFDQLPEQLKPNYKKIMTILDYKTPDSAIFGLNAKDERVFFRDVRAVTDDKELIELFKIRQKIFVLNQIQVLDDNKAAFPLIHMTLFSIKNLTKVLYGKSKVDEDNVVDILMELDSSFKEQVSVDKYKEFWVDREWQFAFMSKARIFYKLAFLDLQKGYTLDYDDQTTLQEYEDVFLRLNPGWLWNCYKNYAEKVFNNLSEYQVKIVANYIRQELL